MRPPDGTPAELTRFFDRFAGATPVLGAMGPPQSAVELLAERDGAPLGSLIIYSTPTG